jgi:hypothetical protein
MARLGILGVAGLALAMWAVDVQAQRGGAARGGVRGAVVGGAIGGESGASAGAVIGATRGAMNKEATARAQYQATATYQNAQHSNFNQVPPEVLVVPMTAGAAAKGAETVIRSKDGKPALGVTYPDDWQQKTGDHFVSAVSKDGQAWAVVATMEGVMDKQAGIEKVKDGIQKSLSDIKYDDPVKTGKGALMVTGTGKTKKSKVDVVFAAAVIDSGPGQLAGAAFVVDDNVDEYYKDTVRYICSTIRLAKDFAK